MILDKDDKIIQETYENAFLTHELLEKEGFKSEGHRYDYENYKYQKSSLGVVQLRVYDMWDLPNVNYRIFPNDGIVAVADVVNPMGVYREGTSRYLLTVKDLKNYLKFRELVAQISNLEHQASDILSNDLLDKNKYDRQIRGEK